MIEPGVRKYSIERIHIDLSCADARSVMSALAYYAAQVHDSEEKARAGVSWSVARELSDALDAGLVWRGGSQAAF